MNGLQQRTIERMPAGAITLDDPVRAWRLEGAFADVFLVTHDGPRHHLFRVERSEIVTGVGACDGGATILCVPAVDALLRELPCTQQLATAELEGWITALTQSLRPPRPRGIQVLRPGEIAALDRRPVAPANGVVWVRALDAASHLLEDDRLPAVPPLMLFPVAANGWLAPVASTRFECFSTDESADAGDLSQALERFLACVRRRWELHVAALEDAQQQRVEQNRFADKERMQEALRGLSAPLGMVVAAAPVSAVNRQSLYMSCFRRIGEMEHIVFRAPRGDARNADSSMAESIAHASGVRCRAVTLRETWWKGDHGTLLAMFADGGAPVALLPSGGGYRYYDPRDGRVLPVTARLAATLEGDAMSFYRPLPWGKVDGKQLAAFAFEGMGRDLSRVLLFGLLSAAVALTLPIVVGHVFDKVLPLADRHQLGVAVLLLVIAGFVGSIFNIAQGSLVLRIQGRMEARVQSAMWGRLLDLPASFLRGFSVGELAMRGMSVETMRRVLTGVAVRSVLVSLSSVFSLALLLHYDAALALKSLLLVVVAVAFVTGMSARELVYQRQLMESTSKLSGVTLGLLNGIAKLRVASAEPRAFLQWSVRYSKKVQLELSARRLKIWMSTISAFWGALSIASLFALYVMEMRQSMLAPASAPVHAMSMGDFVAFLTAFGMLMHSVLGLAGSMLDIVAIQPAYELAKPLLETPTEFSLDRALPGEISGNVELRHVSFRYEESLPNVLRDVSLQIAPGEFVAIVGSSGSGKSTLLRLLLGFEQPNEGSVLYDGRDLRTLDPREVRRQIGVVLQSGRIRAGSIYENIMGGASGTVDDAWEAARMAGLAADIEAMPMGMHTTMSEGGGTLSGGQRQRVLIARALVRRPQLLYFDEATSALDNHTQATVSRSLEQLKVSRVVIAHRLTTIASADRICVMRMGELVEQGTFQQLMERGGVFAELARRQIV